MLLNIAIASGVTCHNTSGLLSKATFLRITRPLFIRLLKEPLMSVGPNGVFWLWHTVASTSAATINEERPACFLPEENGTIFVNIPCGFQYNNSSYCDIDNDKCVDHYLYNHKVKAAAEKMNDSNDPKYDLDMASYGIVKSMPANKTSYYKGLSWLPKVSFFQVGNYYESHQ